MYGKSFIKAFFITVAVTVGLVYPAAAAPLFEDLFNDTTKIDMENTTAKVDTAAGEIYLQTSRIGANTIAIKHGANQYAVVTLDGADFYTYNAGSMKKDSTRSVTGQTGVIGVALRQDRDSLWLLKSNELLRYDRSTDMYKNALLSVETGLSDLIAFSAHPNEDTVVLLSRNDTNPGYIYTYMATDEGEMARNDALSFNTGIQNAVAVSIVPGTYDVIVASDTDVSYFLYTPGGYILNDALSVSGLSNIRSVTSLEDEYGYVVSTDTHAYYYLYNESYGAMTVIPTLTVNFGDESIATSAKPGGFEYVARMEDGAVRYYGYGPPMTRKPNYEVANVGVLDFGGGRYVNEGDYVSINIDMDTEYYMGVRVDAEEDLPEGTSIEYIVSCDNGASWFVVPKNTVVEITPANMFRVKARLSTTDNFVTPRLLSISLSGSPAWLGLAPPEEEIYPDLLTVLTHMTSNLGFSFDGDLPQAIKAGAQAVFKIKTTGSAETVKIYLKCKYGEMEIDLKGSAQNTPQAQGDEVAGERIWVGRFTVPPDAYEFSEIYFDRIELTKGEEIYIYGDDEDEPDIMLLMVVNSVLYDSDIMISE